MKTLASEAATESRSSKTRRMQGEHLARVERLGHEVEGAFLRRLHGLGDGAVAGHDDDLDVGIAGPEELQEPDAVAVRKDEVDEGEGEVLGVEARGAFGDAPRGIHRVSLALED